MYLHSLLTTIAIPCQYNYDYNTSGWSYLFRNAYLESITATMVISKKRMTFVGMNQCLTVPNIKARSFDMLLLNRYSRIIHSRIIDDPVSLPHITKIVKLVAALTSVASYYVEIVVILKLF
jgi:hypothetical protein